MEFKIGDIININPDSAYISQGMLDRSFMEGVVISQIEYEIASQLTWHLAQRKEILNLPTYPSIYDVLTIYVRWENNTQNTYRYKDLILSVKEHRDKQLDKLLI
jgi:hypothetical protein